MVAPAGPLSDSDDTDEPNSIIENMHRESAITAKATAAAVLEATARAAPAKVAEEAWERDTRSRRSDRSRSPAPSSSPGTIAVDLAPRGRDFLLLTSVETPAIHPPVQWAWTRRQWPETPEDWKALRHQFTLDMRPALYDRSRTKGFVKAYRMAFHPIKPRPRLSPLKRN